jgi:hypothetical protein
LLILGLEPLRRGRIERFVERTGVTVTASSAPYVVDALTRTRRWRFSAVLVAVSGCFAWNIVTDSSTFTTFMGEAVAVAVLFGTLVGELRNATVRGDAPRTASLVARQESHYVGSWASVCPRAVAGVAIALGVVTALRHGDDLIAPVVFGGVAVAAWVVSRAATRFVLERPRCADPDPDVLAADEGLRSRALHAIGGATCFVSLWSVAPLVVFPFMSGTEENNTPLALLLWLGLLVAAIVSWRLAAQPFPIGGPGARPSGFADEPASEASSS